jgi:hypothetical protein
MYLGCPRYTIICTAMAPAISVRVTAHAAIHNSDDGRRSGLAEFRFSDLTSCFPPGQ